MSYNFNSQKKNARSKTAGCPARYDSLAGEGEKTEIIKLRKINVLSISAPFLLSLYVYKKIISPLLPSSCRFYPTCSEYAFIAFKRYGIFKGFYLSLKRLLRCNPFCEGGYDPVPEMPEKKKIRGQQ